MKNQEENAFTTSVIASDAHREDQDMLNARARGAMSVASDRGANQMQDNVWQEAYRDPRSQSTDITDDEMKEHRKAIQEGLDEFHERHDGKYADNSKRPCAECRHCDYFGQCCKKVQFFDPVLGPLSHSCRYARIDSDECGPSGRLFEERSPNIFKRLVGWVKR